MLKRMKNTNTIPTKQSILINKNQTKYNIIYVQNKELPE